MAIAGVIFLKPKIGNKNRLIVNYAKDLSGRMKFSLLGKDSGKITAELAFPSDPFANKKHSTNLSGFSDCYLKMHKYKN